MSYLAGKIVIEVRAGAPNNGKGESNLAPVKRTQVGRDTYPYVSAQSWRRWLRDTLALTAVASPVTRSGSGQKQVAYTAGEPHRYLDDDLFGFMRAVKDQETQRDTVIATGTLMAVAPTRPTEDFGTMSRGMAADERPVLHGHEFYTADLAADLLIDAPSVGTFSLGGNGVRTNLLDAQADEARTLGAADVEFRGVPAVRLPVERRRERLAALLAALAALRGGAKHAAHYGDRTPAWLLLVPMKGGINPFGRVVSAERSATRIDVDVLRAELDAWADEVDGPALIGWAPGYLPDQRAEATQRLTSLLAEGRVVIGHPRQVLRDAAEQLRKGALDRWLRDPLPALP